MFRRLLCSSLLAALCAACADSPSPSPNPPDAAATRSAIDAAIDWLVRHQDEDGRWDADAFMKHDVSGEACDGAGNATHDVGVTGLALLALLGSGNSTHSGPNAESVRRGVQWLRGQQHAESGLIGTPSSNEFIYDHAIAAFALCEAMLLGDEKALRHSCQRAVNYIESHRNPYAVWRYQPRDGDNDTSVTGWCVLALSSAKFAGLEVNPQALESAGHWLDQLTDPATGRTGYTERGGPSSRRVGDHSTRYPRDRDECMTAVSLLCRFLLGNDPKQDTVMAKQADLLLAKPPAWTADGSNVDEDYWYYATLGLYQMGGAAWQSWNARLTRVTTQVQHREGNRRGSFDPIGVWSADGGRVFTTALMCLCMEASQRYAKIVR